MSARKGVRVCGEGRGDTRVGRCFSSFMFVLAPQCDRVRAGQSAMWTGRGRSRWMTGLETLRQTQLNADARGPREGAVEYGLCLPECETGLQLSSMGGWKLGLRAGWNGAAARRSRSAITRGGMGGLWMRDSRIPASVVANFRIAACYFRSRFRLSLIHI